MAGMLRAGLEANYCCMVKQALRNGANINDKVGISILAPLSYVLCQYADDCKDPHRIVKVILKEAKKQGVLEEVVNKKDSTGYTAIMYAIQHDFSKSIKLILDTGVCDLTVTDEEGHTIENILKDMSYYVFP